MIQVQSAKEGWVCPVCKRGIHPDEKSCAHGEEKAAAPTPLYQPWPYEPTRTYIHGDHGWRFLDWACRNPTHGAGHVSQGAT